MRNFTTLLCSMILAFPLALAAQDKTFVSIPVSVSDREGRYISGLKKDDFTILHDGKEQKISFFETESEPVSVALLIDTSESTKAVLPEIRAAARDFIDLLNARDRCLVATFDSEVKVLQPFTSNREALEDSLEKIQTAEQEGTVVFSAVEQLTSKAFAGALDRKVIVLLSDGKDFGSAISRRDLLGQLEESDIMIYSIFYQTGRVFVEPSGAVKQEAVKEESIEKPKEEKKKKKKKGYSIRIGLPREVNTAQEIELSDKVQSIEAVNVLQELSDTTAGRFYMSDAPNLSRIFKQIAAELRQQYRLGFNAAGGESASNNVIVKVNRADAVVQSRSKNKTKKL